MRDRSELIARIVCYMLAALLVFELARIVLRINPLARVVVPQLPSLADSTPQSSHATNAAPAAVPAAHATNGVAHVDSVHNSSAPTGTNVTSMATAATGGSNSAPVIVSAETNAAMPRGTPNVGTNAIPALASTGTNGTHGSVQNESGPKAIIAAAGNAPPHLQPGMPPGFPGMPPGIAMAGMPFGSPMPGPKLADLPPAIQARINRITDSEILGTIVHPLPMALLGIAGDYAFLRAASGQTGMVKEGDQLAGLKLLRIGVNRVLVEQDGQQKELTIFSGLGGESLLSKQETHP